MFTYFIWGWLVITHPQIRISIQGTPNHPNLRQFLWSCLGPRLKDIIVSLQIHLKHPSHSTPGSCGISTSTVIHAVLQTANKCFIGEPRMLPRRGLAILTTTTVWPLPRWRSRYGDAPTSQDHDDTMFHEKYQEPTFPSPNSRHLKTDAKRTFPQNPPKETSKRTFPSFFQERPFWRVSSWETCVLRYQYLQNVHFRGFRAVKLRFWDMNNKERPFQRVSGIHFEVFA